jgi:hypothetical protein
MQRHAVLRLATCVLCLTSLPTVAQQSDASASPSRLVQSPAARQSALSLLEEALAGTGSLTLPANRLAIELRAFPVVWSRSDARARSLVQQMAGDFAQYAGTLTQAPDQNPIEALNILRNQRNNIANRLASTDPELALLFVFATLPDLTSIHPDEDSDDHALVLDLAAQVAQHDPRRALQLAQQQLKDVVDLPQSMIGLLEQVQRYDSQAGANLLRDIVDHLRGQNLAEDTEALTFAASLLANQFARQSETGKPDNTLCTLAETVATAALNSDATRESPYLMGPAMSALDALVPSKSAMLFRRTVRIMPPISIQSSLLQKFNHARTTGNSDQTLALLSQAPEDIRPQMVEQAAWGFASNGDLERTNRVVQSLEPWKRNGVMQLAIRCAALTAAGRGNFSSARQLVSQITDDETRATLLSDLALYAFAAEKPRLAEDLLGEATALVMNRGAGTSAFAAQLKVALAYLHVKPGQAIPLLERSPGQIEQALSAAAQLEGFLPDRHSFEGNELMLDQGFLYRSLVEPYALATAELATHDLQAARSLADRLPLPEARLMTEVFVATGVLTQNDQAQAASNANNEPRLLLDKF